MRRAGLLVAFLALTASAAWPQGEIAPTTQDGPMNIKPPVPRPDKDGVYSPGPGIPAPIVLARVPAVYPADAPADGIEGECVLSTVIGADGVPANIQVVHTNGTAFDAAAIEAVKQSKFAPGTLDGKPVPVHIFVRTRFFNDRRIAYPRILNRYDSNSDPSQSTQNGASTSAPAAPTPPGRVNVYAVGPGLTAPELLPPEAVQFPAEKCKEKLDGKALLSLVVDEAGNPRNIQFLRPIGTDLDQFARRVVAADRFKPATKNGTPVAVAQSAEVDLQACLIHSKDSAGKKTSLLQLWSAPIQSLKDLPSPLEEAVVASDDLPLINSESGAFHTERIGGRVTAPVALNSVEAEFTNEASRAKYQGVCQLSLIVDEHGVPQNVFVVQGLGYGLNEKAVAAANKYRFKPAMRNGVPIAARIMVQVNFRLY
jgi:TonB family protein